MFPSPMSNPPHVVLETLLEVLLHVELGEDVVEDEVFVVVKVLEVPPDLEPTRADWSRPSVLVGFGRLRSALVGFGRFWSVSVGFGRFWSAFEDSCLNINILTFGGP